MKLNRFLEILEYSNTIVRPLTLVCHMLRLRTFLYFRIAVAAQCWKNYTTLHYTTLQ